MSNLSDAKHARAKIYEHNAEMRRVVSRTHEANRKIIDDFFKTHGWSMRVSSVPNGDSWNWIDRTEYLKVQGNKSVYVYTNNHTDPYHLFFFIGDNEHKYDTIQKCAVKAPFLPVKQRVSCSELVDVITYTEKFFSEKQN